jgi:hypothetical protein
MRLVECRRNGKVLLVSSMVYTNNKKNQKTAFLANTSVMVGGSCKWQRHSVCEKRSPKNVVPARAS